MFCFFVAEIKYVTEKEKRENVTKREIFRRQVLADIKVPLKTSVEAEDIIDEEYPGKAKPFTHPGEKPGSGKENDDLNSGNRLHGDNVTDPTESEYRKNSFHSIQSKMLPKINVLSRDKNDMDLEEEDEVNDMKFLSPGKKVKKKSGKL